MNVLPRIERSKEYLTVAPTPEELKKYEPGLRAAGFRKRRYGYGQSPNTGEFYQWWDRKGQHLSKPNFQRERREQGRCIACGEPAIESVRGGPSQYCAPHRDWYRRYMKDYMRRRKSQQLAD